MNKLNINKNEGITLIAIVITVILLLILSAVTIKITTEGGIFNNAKNTVKGMENIQQQKNSILQNIRDNY